MSAAGVLARMDTVSKWAGQIADRGGTPNRVREAAKGIEACQNESRADVAELIADRDRLANIVRSHEAQILRMTEERAELVEAAKGYRIEADGGPGDGNALYFTATKAVRLRAALARITGEGA